ncbi:hypothetical protein LTS17_000620 [Exophiala oligosperma]
MSIAYMIRLLLHCPQNRMVAWKAILDLIVEGIAMIIPGDSIGLDVRISLAALTQRHLINRRIACFATYNTTMPCLLESAMAAHKCQALVAWRATLAMSDLNDHAMWAKESLYSSKG